MGFWTSCRTSCQQAVVVLDSSSSSGAKDYLLDTTSRRPVHNLDDDGSCRRTITSSHRTTTPDEIIIITTTTTSSLPITNSDDRTSSSTVATTELLVGPLLLSEDDAVADPNDEKAKVEERTSSSLRAEDLLLFTAQKSSDDAEEDDVLLSIPLTKEQRMVCDSFHGSSNPSLNDSSGHSLLSGTSRSHHHQHHHHTSIITIEEPATDQRIHFGKISIREYPNTVGDSPSTTRGVPITLCWTPRAEYELDLEDFEEVRPPHRRTVMELQMSSLDRLRRLKSEGWSGGELQQQYYVQERTTSQQQRRRQASSWRYQWDWYQERLWRGVWGIALRRRRKQRERDWIQKWQEEDRKRTAIIHSPSSILKNTTGIRI